MNRLEHKKQNSLRRVNRVRKTVRGSKERPRLAVSISNSHITAQLIDDDSGKTLAYATTVGQKVNGSMVEKSAWVGEAIAKKAKTAKVSRAVLDRHDKKYHGRVKALAEAARKGGLEF